MVILISEFRFLTSAPHGRYDGRKGNEGGGRADMSKLGDRRDGTEFRVLIAESLERR